ncbi:hypothetical protein L1987_16412 [Smallanthus sonchifolius]|uniref:Uncharacterized protein n=1 Tax=Smallanthus sonchifolius TaxID=185202 RepID=A0ACB9JAJ3_9ASTR|nr:hypothetical protein L1987_16412 [Smallanthus sonchifolius]
MVEEKVFNLFSLQPTFSKTKLGQSTENITELTPLHLPGTTVRHRLFQPSPAGDRNYFWSIRRKDVGDFTAKGWGSHRLITSGPGESYVEVKACYISFEKLLICSERDDSTRCSELCS